MTIAQQLNIKDFPFIIKDKNSKIIYHEDSYGYWYKREFDVNGSETYHEDSSGYWCKSVYDVNGNKTYYENSYGDIVDNRLKPVIELTLQEIATKLGINVDQLRIKE